MTASSTMSAHISSVPSATVASGWWRSSTPKEFQWVFGAKNRAKEPDRHCYEFFREERRVGAYYFYVLDPHFGPGFIKICTYFPYPAKVWLNGHEWAKRQADHGALRYTALANGFAACADEAALQAICDRFG